MSNTNQQLPAWIRANMARERAARERLFGPAKPAAPPHAAHPVPAPPPAASHRAAAKPAASAAPPVAHPAATHAAATTHVAAVVHQSPGLFALSNHQALWIWFVTFGGGFLIAFGLAVAAQRRHFPSLARAPRWALIVAVTAVLGYGIASLTEIALLPLVGSFGLGAVFFAVLGWLPSAAAVYWAEIFFLGVGWQRASRQNGTFNWFTALVSGALFRYLLLIIAAGIAGALAFSMLNLFHPTTAAGVPFLVGAGIAMFFHPADFFFWKSIRPALSGLWRWLFVRAPRGDGAPPLEPAAPSRGTWLVNAASASRYLSWLKSSPSWPADPIPFGSQVIHSADEPLHVKIMGAAGSGKSTAIRAMLRIVAARPNQRAIIADPDGGYAARFFSSARGDVIINPFDARSIGWDFFSDIRAEYDPDNVAAALIPERGGDQGEWAHYAQQFTAACIRSLAQRQGKERPTVADLWRMIATEPPAVLAGQLAGTEAAPFLARGNEKMFGSIRATAVGNVKGLAYLRPGVRELSLSDYAQSNAHGWIFMTYTADQIAAVKSIYSTMLRVLVFATMSRPEGDSGTWFVIDELDALGKIPALQDALPRLRKFGGRCVLGFQSIGQLIELFGANIGAALVENCSNTMILRCGGKGNEGTSAYAAGLLGQREVLKTQEQTASSGGTQADGSQHSGWSKSTSSSLQVEDVMLASEIEHLANLSGVCHSPNFNFWSHFTLAPDSMPMIAPAFVPRPAEQPASAAPAASSGAAAEPLEIVKVIPLV